jgi:glycogen debranching enzyme
MSTDDAAYNPLSYHNGTVWPHDTSLCAWGLARSGRREETRRLIRAMIDAAGSFEHRLPEVFAGFDRAETPFPVAYPTAARPQAWAAGTPVLLLQLLLGLRPDREQRRLACDSAALPPWAGELRLSGVQAFDRSWDVAVVDGTVEVVEA